MAVDDCNDNDTDGSSDNDADCDCEMWNYELLDFFFNPCEYHTDICVMSCVHPSGRPSCMAKALMLNIAHKLFNQFFSHLPCLQAPLTSAGLFPFHWSWSCLGSWGQRKAKAIDFIFSHIFHLIRMKFDVVMKQCKLNILRLILKKI